MFKSVIFDLDGTLLDTIDDLADAGNWVCARNGWPTFTREQFKHMVGNGIPKLVERFSPESARTPAQLAATLAQFNARYAAHKEDKTRPYPGIPELLTALGRAGVQTAVFSNKSDGLARAIIAHYFGASVQAARGSMAGVPCKPAPEGLYALMDALGADRGSTLYVGDSNVDVETAHNAGLPCCGVLWGFRGEAELTAAGADSLAADTAQLEALILRGAQPRAAAAAAARCRA
jgi:phosphoglycolate phosphatase